MNYYIIDADSHLTEPRDVWSSRVPRRFVDQMPKVVRDDDGADVWVLGGQPIQRVGRTAPAGWDTYPYDWPLTYEDCHPAAYDAGARLRYLDENGIWAQVLYPNVAGFGGQRFLGIREPEVKLAAVQAYNDFLIEWTSADSDRLIGVMATPFWDVEAVVAEIERCAAAGCRAILFTGEPQRFDMPLLGDRYWDPLWSIATETSMPIHFHIGGGEYDRDGLERRRQVHGVPGASTHIAVELFLKNGVQCVDLLGSGVLQRFPEVKFVSVESGIGWVPFVLETADYTWLGATERGRRRGEELLPSELFRRQVYITYWFEQIAPRRLLEELPLDNILFETDFPHPACLYQNIYETIEAGLEHVSDDVRRKLLWENAANLYNVRTPEPAT